MKKTAKFLFVALLLLAILVPATPALADAVLEVVEYKCLACNKLFYAVKGCDLADKKYKDEGPQLSNIFRFGKGWQNLEGCKGFKYHIFDKVRDGKISMSGLSKSLSKFALIKGKNMNGSLTIWRCFICKQVVYSLNKDHLIIRDWDNQQSRFFDMYGRPISKCTPPYFGHVFEKLEVRAIYADFLTQIFDKLYWVKE